MPPGPLQRLDRSPVLGGRRKVVLVTRGGTPLGRALVLGLADAGFDIAVDAGGAPRVGAELAREVRRRGRRVLLLDPAGDDLDPEERLLQEIEDRLGRLDAVVTIPGPPPLEGEVAAERLLEEPFRLVRSAARLLRESRGSVVHCLEGGEPDRGAPLRALTQALSRILAPWVRVNAVAPPTTEPVADPDPGTGETVRAVLYVLASPHLNGEVVRVAPRG